MLVDPLSGADIRLRIAQYDSILSACRNVRKGDLMRLGNVIQQHQSRLHLRACVQVMDRHRHIIYILDLYDLF